MSAPLLTPAQEAEALRLYQIGLKAGRKPKDSNELWHYYYAPPGIIRQVCRDDAVIRRMAGPVYSESRQSTWQLSNKDYLEQLSNKDYLEQRARDLAG